MTLQKMIQKSQIHIEKAVHSNLIDILSKNNPDKQYSHAPGGGVQVWEEDADVQMDLDYYGGKRQTKANAIAKQKALTAQRERIANGTFAENQVTPDIHEKLLKRLSRNGNFQRYLP